MFGDHVCGVEQWRSDGGLVLQGLPKKRVMRLTLSRVAEGSRQRWVVGVRWVGVGHERDGGQSSRDGLDAAVVGLSGRRGERRGRGQAALRVVHGQLQFLWRPAGALVLGAAVVFVMVGALLPVARGRRSRLLTGGGRGHLEHHHGATGRWW